jgi:hypothetical protein
LENRANVKAARRSSGIDRSECRFFFAPARAVFRRSTFVGAVAQLAVLVDTVPRLLLICHDMFLMIFV